jgi:hypothetical protein
MSKMLVAVGIFFLAFLVFVTPAYAQDKTLTIKSAYDAPTPYGVGRWKIPVNTVITESVTSPTPDSTGYQYLCTGWKAKGSAETLPPTGTGTSVTFTITTNTTITWLWKTQCYFTANNNPSGGGYITPPSGWYDKATTLTVEAHPNPGWAFDYWSGALRGTTNPQYLTLRAPRTVTANYHSLTPLYFTVNSAQGAPVPPVGTYTYYSGDTVPASNCGPTPYSGGTGIQYVCTGHLGTGDLTSGPETSIPSFVITMDSSVTWLWQAQYQLTTTTLPPEGGSITRSPDQTWYDSGIVVQLTAIPNAGYVFTEWSGDLSGTTNPEDLTMNGAKSVTANFTPSLTFTVISAQGAPVPPVGTYPHSEGDTVSANCGSTPYSGGNGIRYVCTGHLGTGNLTDGSETSVSFVITMNSSVTWTWKTQYYLKVEPTGIGAPAGAGWYDAGTTASWSVTSPWPGTTGVRYITSPTSGTVLMDAPKTVTVPWTTQYYLTVVSTYGNPQGAGWYNAGSTAHWSVTSPWAGGTGIQYVADPSSGDVLMDSAKTVTVSWTTQYYLTVVSAYGAPAGTGWYDAGSTAHWSVTSPWAGGTGVQYVADPSSGDVLMDSAKTVTVSWTTQYLLTIDSAYGNPVGAGWYNAGVTAHWSVTSPYPGATGVQYVTSPTSGDVLMDSPQTVTVTWTTQYLLTIDSAYGAPTGAGWYNAGTTAHWSVTSPYPGATGVQYITSPTSGDVVMSSPQTVTVTWITQYYLTVVSAYGNPQGEGWYDAGATAHWSVTSPWPGPEGTRWVTDPYAEDVLMDSPKTVTVSWTTQYYLTVVSAYGAPTGEGWYNAGVTASWSVTSPWPEENPPSGIRYVTDPTSGTVLMDSPQTVTVPWLLWVRVVTFNQEGNGVIWLSPE